MGIRFPNLSIPKWKHFVLKCYYLSCILHLLSTNVNAQNRHETGVGIGINSRLLLLKQKEQLNNHHLNFSGNAGPFYFQHKIFVTRKQSFSIMLLMEQHRFKQHDLPFTQNYYSALLGYTDYWVKRNYFSLYTELAIGCTQTTTKQTNASNAAVQHQSVLAYQITPLGFRFGNRIGVYLEGGYGFKGLVNGGFSFRF